MHVQLPANTVVFAQKKIGESFAMDFSKHQFFPCHFLVLLSRKILSLQ